MAAAAPVIWNDLYIVRSYEVDARGRLAVAAVCNYLQDAAGCHANALGVSVDQLHPLNLTWVLVRLRLRLVRDLAWQDRLHVQTWPSHQERLISQRDFLLTDGAGEDVGRCVTSWVLMDLQRWRPQRLSALPQPLPIPDRPRVLTSVTDKLVAPEALHRPCRFQVGDRDLDRNGHVNNVRYVEWALETVPANILNTCRLAALDIDFTGEALHEETILAGCQPVEGPQLRFRHGLVRRPEDDDSGGCHPGHDLARAETQWRQRPL